MEIILFLLLMLSWSAYAGLWVHVSEWNAVYVMPGQPDGMPGQTRSHTLLGQAWKRLQSIPTGVLIASFGVCWLLGYGLILSAVLHVSFIRLFYGA